MKCIDISADPLSEYDPIYPSDFGTRSQRIRKLEQNYAYALPFPAHAIHQYSIYNYVVNKNDEWRTPYTSFHIKRKNKMEELSMNDTMNTTANTILSEVKRYAYKRSLTHLKNRFGVTLKLNFDPVAYRRFLCWLKKYDKNFKSHVAPANTFGTKKEYKLKDCDFIIPCGYHTYARIFTQSAIKDSLSKVDIFSEVHISENDIGMYIFGKECHKVAKEIKRIDNERGIACYKIAVSKYRDKDENATPDIYYEDLKGRSKDSIFLNNNVKEKIINHIDTFLQNRSIYEKRNLLYKTGILLYGEPGTGKSSLANMIATEYNSDMVLINMSEFSKINTDFVTTTINADDKFYVVVLEDIDCVIGDREDENQDLENKKNVNKLLQFLDSTSSPTNVVFVATTNHIEKLDEAIKRDGRFDLIINITNIDETAATKMCKSFGITDEDVIKRIFDKNSENGKINPAKLQNLILQEIHI
jgi:AAA+ superfamily predicted ATPase